MDSSSLLLALQIKRLPFDEAKKKHLLKDFQAFSPEQQKAFVSFLKEYDDVSLKKLNAKSVRSKCLRDFFIRTKNPEEITKEEMLAVIRWLKTVFEEPQKLALLVFISDDNFLQMLEEMLMDALDGESGHQEEMKRFFREARLQKEAESKK